MAGEAPSARPDRAAESDDGEVACIICGDPIEGEPAATIKGWDDPDAGEDDAPSVRWDACGKDECVVALITHAEAATPQMDWASAQVKALTGEDGT